MNKQKRVSFKVAKAIKNAGYSQGNTDKCYLTADHNQYYKEGQIVDNEDGEWNVLTKNLADIPTYLDVWLWLWREKNMRLSVEYVRATETEYESWCTLNQEHLCNLPVSNGDSEEAIIAAIEYLINNDLIK